MEESCALCEKKAMIHCDSDQAKLCRDCDEKVHSVNFLVAKHSRVLLCCSCYSPTPWKASGTKLTPTVSFCHSCTANPHARLNQVNNNVQHHRDFVEGDGKHEFHNVSDHDEEVPMSSDSATSPHSADSHDEEVVCSSAKIPSAALINDAESTSMSIQGDM
ncbi:B-box domain protein 30, partial [Mucuna pruriens]